MATSKNERRKAARRAVVDGYPVSRPFHSKDEVDRYFATERIVCLLCGETFRRLGGHLSTVHEVSEPEYRELYGLPTFRGLTGTLARENYSNAVTSSQTQMDRISRMGREMGGTAVAKGTRQRRVAPYRVTLAQQTGLHVHGLTSGYADVDKAKYLVAMGTGLTPKELGKLAGFPSLRTMYEWRSSDPKFTAAFDEVFELMPYASQAKMQKMGRAFREDLRRLFQKGYSDHSAAKALGVTAMTCNRITKVWREQERAGQVPAAAHERPGPASHSPGL